MSEETKFIDKIKIYLKELGYFLSSGIFIKNFLGIIGTIGLLIFITMWSLKCHTLHGESIKVPHLKDLHLNAAKKLVNARDLNIVVDDSVYIANKKPNVIIESRPPKGSLVKKNRSIYVKVTKFTPPMVSLPSLIGNYDFKNYSEKLNRLGLVPKVIKKVFDSKQAKNTIKYLVINGDKIYQKQIEDGFEIHQGTEIGFVITKRSDEFVEIPDLSCMSYEEASAYLIGIQINEGSIIKDNTVSNINSSFIWKQTPPFKTGKRIKIGQKISLYLTQNLPDDCQ